MPRSDLVVALAALDERLRAAAPNLAVFLTFDRPQRASERPALAKTYFAQRCETDAELNDIATALRLVGAYVELVEGEVDLLRLLTSERFAQLSRSLRLIYNGIEGGITEGGFHPGRKALIPAVADALGVMWSNSNAYACALGRHKYHYYTVLQASGVPSPPAWQFDANFGWAGGRRPPNGTEVLVKSTFEAWSVGVTDASRFAVDEKSDARVATIAAQIGQPVCVQEFVEGDEVELTVIATPELLVLPPVMSWLAKAPGDPRAFVTIDDNLRTAGVTYPPFDCDERTRETLHKVVTDAFRALQLGAFARIDCRVDRAGTPWVIDVGVAPSLDRESSSWASFEDLGFSYDEYIRVVVGASLAQHDTRNATA